MGKAANSLQFQTDLTQFSAPAQTTLRSILSPQGRSLPHCFYQNTDKKQTLVITCAVPISTENQLSSTGISCEIEIPFFILSSVKEKSWTHRALRKDQIQIYNLPKLQVPEPDSLVAPTHVQTEVMITEDFLFSTMHVTLPFDTGLVLSPLFAQFCL